MMKKLLLFLIVLGMYVISFQVRSQESGEKNLEISEEQSLNIPEASSNGSGQNENSGEIVSMPTQLPLLSEKILDGNFSYYET